MLAEKAFGHKQSLNKNDISSQTTETLLSMGGREVDLIDDDTLLECLSVLQERLGDMSLSFESVS